MKKKTFSNIALTMAVAVFFLIAVLGSAQSTAQQDIQMLPPTDYANNPCKGITGGILLWDGANSIRCIPGSSGNVNGNVGIGTTDPFWPLVVYGNTPVSAIVRSTSGNQNSGLVLGTGTSTVDYELYTPANSTDLRFYSGGDKITFTSAGNVGIGTTDPSLGGKVNSRFTVLQSDGSTGLAIGNATTPRLAITGNSSGSWTAYDYAAGRFTAGITQSGGMIQVPEIGIGIAPSNSYALYIKTADAQHGIHSEANTNGFYGIISYANVTGAIAGGFFDGLGNNCVFAFGYTAWNCSSDARLKQDIKPIEGALDKLALIKGVTFRWKADPTTGEKMGVIAQDVIKAFPDAVTLDPSRRKGKKSYYSVAYDSLIAPLISGVNELNARTSGLPAKVADIEKSNAALKADNDNLHALVAAQRREIDALKARMGGDSLTTKAPDRPPR